MIANLDAITLAPSSALGSGRVLFRREHFREGTGRELASLARVNSQADGRSDGRIIHEISDVATDPASAVVRQGSIVTGTRDGVTIRVVIDNSTGEIITGYPTNLPRNP